MATSIPGGRDGPRLCRLAQRILQLGQGIPAARTQQDERLKVAILAAHTRSRETYGVRRLQPELASEGFIAGRDRIAHVRRELGLRCRQQRKCQATTNSNHTLPVAENLLPTSSSHQPRRIRSG